MRLCTRIMTAISLGAAAVLGISGTASATTDQIQLQVDEVLAEFPGGTQTGPGEVSWEDGAVKLNIGLSISPRSAVGSCANGSFCAYSSSNLIGSKISFSTCSATNSVAPLKAAVRSIANGRSSGSVYGYNGTTKAYTVAASSYKNTTGTITRLGC